MCVLLWTLADLGGVPGARPALWDPILSFLHTFLSKSAHIGGPRPQWVHAPLREILDPPLAMEDRIDGHFPSLLLVLSREQ